MQVRQAKAWAEEQQGKAFAQLAGPSTSQPGLECKGLQVGSTWPQGRVSAHQKVDMQAATGSV